MLKLHLQNREGAQSALFFDPRRPSLTWEDGTPLPVGEKLTQLFPPECRQGKKLTEVRLVLGRGCNYRCSYCHQAPGHYQNPVVSPMLPEKLVDLVCGHVDGEALVQFWGGEPLLYLQQLRRYTECFSDRGVREFCVITNGSLLTERTVDFLLEHDFSVALSHDGQGQGLRGGNPFSDEKLLAQIRRLAAKPERFSINPVMTAQNAEHLRLERYMAGILGPVSFGEAVPLMAVDKLSAACAIPVEGREEYTRQLYAYLYGTQPLAQPFVLYAMQIQGFLSALKSGGGVPTSRYCTGTNPDAIVVDTAGGVLPCQSFTALDVTPFGEPFMMGHVGSAKEKWHRPGHATWQSRKKCPDCPVVYFCRGGCPYQEEDDFFELSCQGRLHHYMALLAYAVSILTDGCVLMEATPFDPVS